MRDDYRYTRKEAIAKFKQWREQHAKDDPLHDDVLLLDDVIKVLEARRGDQEKQP